MSTVSLSRLASTLVTLTSKENLGRATSPGACESSHENGLVYGYAGAFRQILVTAHWIDVSRLWWLVCWSVESALFEQEDPLQELRLERVRRGEA